MTPSNPKKKAVDLRLAVAVALRKSSFALPETEEEIAAAEAELEQDTQPLPAGLRDPFGFLAPDRKFKLDRSRPVPVLSPKVEDDLACMARAARSGGKLTAEVEERMHRDRAAAEENAKNGNKGR